jgi:hypothetical protein
MKFAVIALVFFLSIGSIHSFNFTEHEEKIKQHRKQLEEASSKVEQRTRESLSKHEQQARDIRQRMDKSSQDAMEKAKARIAEMRARRDAQLQQAKEKTESAKTEESVEEKEAKIEQEIAKEAENVKASQTVTPPSPSEKVRAHQHPPKEEKVVSDKKIEEIKREAAADPAASASSSSHSSHNILDEKLNEIKSKQHRHSANIDKSKNALETHGVDDALVTEINRMAASFIPRDAILNHISTHFPDKKTEDWNDIMIASLAKNRRRIPGQDTDRAARQEALLKQKKFERAKQSFETQQKNDL